MPRILLLMLLATALAGCGDDPAESAPQDDAVVDDSTDPEPVNEVETEAPAEDNQPATPPANDDEPENSPPEVTFAANVLEGEAPLDVSFSLAATDADGDAMTWSIVVRNGSDLGAGDLEESTELNATFDEPGTFDVVATVDDGSAAASANVTIVVFEAAAPEPTGPTYENSES